MHKYKFHGDPNRFEIVAEFVENKYKNRIKYIADVAGGQGMLTRLLRKKNYKAEVVDPRGWTIKGVPSRKEEFKSGFADYYDLIVGLHPDEAIKEVAKSAIIRPTILIPCCNFWDASRKLGRDALLEEVEKFYKENLVEYERIIFDFQGPKNIGLVSEPPH